MYFLVLVILAWVGVLLIISWKNGLIGKGVGLPNSELGNKKITSYTESFFVENWDSESSFLYLDNRRSTPDGKKTVIVDVPKIKIILTAKDGNDSLVFGVDDRWKTLFCKGDEVLLQLNILKDGDREITEIRNIGERSCSEVK